MSHTICAPEVTFPLPAQPIDPPTLAMTFRINDSPLAGTEGDKVQSRVIRERLLREAEGNVALRISESTEKDSMEVAGRGELAARHPDRDHAARRLRALGVAAQGAVRAQHRRRHPGADRGSRHRRRRGAFRHRGAEALRAQSRDDRDAPVGRRARAARVPRADARADRLSGRAAHRHPRHRGDEPPVPRLWAVSRRDRRPPQRRADLQRCRRGGRLRAVEPGGPRADDDRARLEGLSRHDRRRAHPRQRPRGERAQGQEAHQHPHPLEGRGGAADPADPDDAWRRRSPISRTTNWSR